jgi:hypothetical protein
MKHQQAFLVPLSVRKLVPLIYLYIAQDNSNWYYYSYRLIRYPGVVCGGHKEVFCQTQVTNSSPVIPEVYVEIYLNRTSGISHPTSQQEE